MYPDTAESREGGGGDWGEGPWSALPLRASTARTGTRPGLVLSEPFVGRNGQEEKLIV